MYLLIIFPIPALLPNLLTTQEPLLNGVHCLLNKLQAEILGQITFGLTFLKQYCVIFMLRHSRALPLLNAITIYEMVTQNISYATQLCLLTPHRIYHTIYAQPTSDCVSLSPLLNGNFLRVMITSFTTFCPSQ